MDNPDTSILKEDDETQSQEVSNLDSQQKVPIDGNEQKQLSDKDQAESKDEISKDNASSKKIDISVDLGNNNNTLQIQVDNNVGDVNADKNENISDIIDSNKKDEAKIELSVNYLDKLFSSTQQQKSVSKEVSDKIDDTKKESEQLNMIDDTKKESDIIEDTIALPLENPEAQMISKEPPSQVNSNDIDINDQNMAEQPLIQNSTDTVQNIQASQSVQNGNQLENPDSPSNNLAKDSILNNADNCVIENTNIANPVENDSYSSSSYYDYEDEANYNPNMFQNLITSASKNGNNNINNNNYQANNKDFNVSNKANLTTLNPILIHQTKEVDDGIPPALKPLIFHAKDSLTYQALCGKQIYGLKQSALTSIVNDLRKYVDIAVDHNLINEACHIQMCIDTIRNDHSAEKIQADKEIVEIDKKLQEANLELEERMNLYVKL
ncbi:hypothetical protein M9Y10_028367 [Tritrichomonas musculus]|uniref:Uncharacterized protein n=1 Tax=Tritrichomonas musculus TaxID=1915356 RepID=A0ABR2KJA3_9EUKA